MAIKSGFFTSILSAGVYDRQYTAKDYTDMIGVFISNGVRRSEEDDFKVTASGLVLSLNAGYAMIAGHYCRNTSTYSLPAVVPPTGGSRVDRVVLRLDTSITTRSIGVVYLEGNGTTAPSLTRNDVIYDLCLAEVTSTAGSTSVSVVDTRSDADLCGWVYSTAGDNSFFESLDNEFDEWFEDVKDTLSSVTLFKRYIWESTISAQTSTVTFSVSQYDADTCFIDVYVNGFRMSTDEFSQSGNVLTFDTALNAGAVVQVNVYKSIDGTGIESVSDEITELQNEYATISGAGKYIYVATGSGDNVILSDIADAFRNKAYDASTISATAKAFLDALGGNTYLAGLTNDAHITISVVGKLGVSAAYEGSGTALSPYKWFNLSGVIFDFSKADIISVECTTGTYNTILNGDIRHCKMKASGGSILAFNGTRAEDCDFSITSTGDGIIAHGGDYINCKFTTQSSTGNAIVFESEADSFIRVIGGRFTAHNTANNTMSTVFYTDGSSTDAVIAAENISCPSVTISGLSQQYLAVCYSGAAIINLVTSTLTTAGSYVTVNSRINKSKA